MQLACHRTRVAFMLREVVFEFYIRVDCERCSQLECQRCSCSTEAACSRGRQGHNGTSNHHRRCRLLRLCLGDQKMCSVINCHFQERVPCQTGAAFAYETSCFVQARPVGYRSSELVISVYAKVPDHDTMIVLRSTSHEASPITGRHCL